MKEPNLIINYASAEQEPLLSIVTLCYNTGRFVVEGMEAIQPQLTDKVEHVILDDGSSDESIDLIRNFAEANDYPLRLYANEKNYGITESKSRILNLAKGDFVADCADDLFMPERVHHDIEKIQHLPDSAAGFYSLAMPFFVDDQGKMQHLNPIGRLTDFDKPTLLTSEVLLENLRQGNFIPAMTVCLRKEVYATFPQDNTYFIEDYPMWAKVAKAGWALEYSPKLTTLYRRGLHSVQNTRWLEVEFDVLRVKLEILGCQLSDFNQTMKEKWFRVICNSNGQMRRRLLDICKQTDNDPGIFLSLAIRNWPSQFLWLLSKLALKFYFWKYI